MTELGEALPSRVTQYGWPWKAHPLETGRRAHGGLITSCVSPLHSSALQGRRGCVPLFLGSLQGLAFPFPLSEMGQQVVPGPSPKPIFPLLG